MSRCDKRTWLVVSGCVPAHGAAPWNTSTESCVHVTPAQRKIGPLNHSRWLTHATRIERLLLSTNPDEPFYSNLVLLATYIIAIYFTGHMEVKYKPSITDSPAHFYNQIRRQAHPDNGGM